MRKIIIPAVLITLTLTGCQQDALINSPANLLVYNDIATKKDTPEFLEINPVVQEKPKSSEEPTAPAVPKNSNVLPNLPDSVYVVENPSDLLTAINKTNLLPSDYIPEKLVKPNVPFYFSEDIPKRYLREVAARALEELFADAKANHIELVGVSGYRSYNTQKTIFTRNVEENGFEAANQFSAYPGQSEHQTGLTIDVSIRELNYGLVEKFGATKEGTWLAENAHKHGFIIRYLKGKEHLTGYTYEPWHIRFVGIEHATEIYKHKWTLEEYLGSLNKESANLN